MIKEARFAEPRQRRENVEESNGWWGLSIGNYINAKIEDGFDNDVEGGWINGAKGLYWHEYGHTFDSRLFGALYLPAIGIPSASGAEWTETRANRWANRYGKSHDYWKDWPYNKNNYPL